MKLLAVLTLAVLSAGCGAHGMRIGVRHNTLVHKDATVRVKVGWICGHPYVMLYESYPGPPIKRGPRVPPCDPIMPD